MTLGTNVGVASSIGGGASLSSLHHNRIQQVSINTKTTAGGGGGGVAATGITSAKISKDCQKDLRNGKRPGKPDRFISSS